MSSLVSSATRAWSLGPAIALSVFDGGARRAASDQALALVDQTSAQYRQVVLTAVQEVEDNLIAIAQLQEQAKAQSQVLQAANKNLDIAQAQYAAGTVSFLNVALAQASALTAERSLLDVKSRQAVAVNVLMKNLAGRWGV
jgi:outer membrane protein TolC